MTSWPHLISRPVVWGWKSSHPLSKKEQRRGLDLEQSSMRRAPKCSNKRCVTQKTGQPDFICGLIKGRYKLKGQYERAGGKSFLLFQPRMADRRRQSLRWSGWECWIFLERCRILLSLLLISECLCRRDGQHSPSEWPESVIMQLSCWGDDGWLMAVVSEQAIQNPPVTYIRVAPRQHLA